VETTVAFWSWLRRLFGARAARALPRTRKRQPHGVAPGARTGTRTVQRAPAAHPTATESEYDVHQGADYGSDDRVRLSDADRLRLEPLKARVATVFRADKGEIGAFPSRAAHILRILDEPNFDVGQLVLITQRDPAISASILRAANSAAFAGVTRIENVRDAVVRLGSQTVAGIATAVTARGLFDAGPGRSRFEGTWSRLWLHSVTTAFAAGGYAVSTRRGNLERCFLGGMLHDIGKTFVLRALGHPSIEDPLEEKRSPALLAALLEDLHVELGQSMAERWNLPDFVIRACAHHHLTPAGDEPDLNIIRVVSGLDEIAVNAQFREGLGDEVHGAARALSLDGFALRALAAEQRDYAAKAGAI
jgi:HD-like signal output (HDOD) protein